MTPRAQDVDRHVGARVRALRVAAGLSQSALTDLIGVTYQQAQKYETGVNRVSASRLYQIAAALGVDPGEFFEGLASPVEQITEQRQLVDLVRHYRQIVEPGHRALLRRLAAALAGASEQGTGRGRSRAMTNADALREALEHVPADVHAALTAAGFVPTADAGNRGEIRLLFGEDGSDYPSA